MAAREIVVTSLEVLPKVNAFDDVVFKAHWKYREGAVSVAGDSVFEAPEPGAEFIPLNSITKETAKSWVIAAIGEKMGRLDEALDYKISQLNNQPFTYDWSPEIVDDGTDPLVD